MARLIDLAIQISIHTPHAGSDRPAQARLLAGPYFNPHSPCGERHRGGEGPHHKRGISIHTPHAGSDARRPRYAGRTGNFNPHSPCGERRADMAQEIIQQKYFNPHSPCGERRQAGRGLSGVIGISIHTPHAGSDCYLFRLRAVARNFNPHSPCGERHYDVVVNCRQHEFQSTLPMRGATPSPSNRCKLVLFQSTLPMRGATSTAYQPTENGRISIHTPHAGSDLAGCYPGLCPQLFQSTLPMRGATCWHRTNCVRTYIFQSTLPMRGATRPDTPQTAHERDFNPHSPCGERRRRCSPDGTG